MKKLPPVHPSDVHSAYAAAANAFSVPVRDVLGATHQRRASDARRVAWWILILYHGMSCAGVARTARRDASTVSHGVARMLDVRDSNTEFKARVNKAMEIHARSMQGWISPKPAALIFMNHHRNASECGLARPGTLYSDPDGSAASL